MFIAKFLISLASTLLALALVGTAQTFTPNIPKAWDDREVGRFELPLVQRDRSPRYMTSQDYYALPVRPIYRSYPAYAQGREPAGYIESLKQKDPEIIFDPTKLRTKADWIEAGRLVFESETQYSTVREQPAAEDVPWPVSKDGVLPFFNPGFTYIIRTKGVLEAGINSCAGCHTRVMPDGSFLEGAQGVQDPPTAQATLDRLRALTPDALRQLVARAWVIFGAPWVVSRDAFETALTKDELIRRAAARRAGVFARQGTSSSHPPHIPSLIGVQDLKYLDATGLVKNRSIADLMRYAAVNEGLDTLAHYGDFQPSPDATPFSGEAGTRYSDEQLYALAQYISSLTPPPNPNPVDENSRRGEQIFRQQGCVNCHTPPLYTNNKLTPASGFTVPEDLLKSEDILNVSVGTDSTLAMTTRRGTGFYKVPSLRGVWYRNAFGHGGQADSLEEWLDPMRLLDDYVPKGFHLGPGPIKGHPFGLRLAPNEKQDLIAFLKTL
jgi:hypothetical protein